MARAGRCRHRPLWERLARPRRRCSRRPLVGVRTNPPPTFAPPLGWLEQVRDEIPCGRRIAEWRFQNLKNDPGREPTIAVCTLSGMPSAYGVNRALRYMSRRA